MTLTVKKMSLISAFTLMLVSHNTAFAQTVLVAEAPAATSVATNAVASPTARVNDRADFTQTTTSKTQLAELGTYTRQSANTPISQSEAQTAQTPDISRWLLKPENSDADTAIAQKDYSKEFTGLSPTVLPNNNLRIGTATQYKDADDLPKLEADRATRNIYSKTDDNFLLRATLDF